MENIAVWPVKEWGGWPFAHVKNIEYAIKLLRMCARRIRNPVIGYYLMRSLGTVEIGHRVLPQRDAERLRREKDNFAYETLDNLLREKSDIERGVYKLHKGLIVGLSSYDRPTEKPYRSRK